MNLLRLIAVNLVNIFKYLQKVMVLQIQLLSLLYLRLTELPMLMISNYCYLDTFFCINHLVAIFVGAFKMKGCPIAQITCPNIKNEKLQGTKHLIPDPIPVNTLPVIIPFFTPFTSKTQLDGKFKKTQKIMQLIGISETRAYETSQAQAIGTEMGETTTQHIPLEKEMKEKSNTMTILYEYYLNSLAGGY